MIEVKNLTKRYGNNLAVDNISFTVGEGEIVGFLGPNGAGKSTTMNILTGYLSSTTGSVKIDGIDVLEDPIKAKSRIGYLPEQPPLYLDMTVLEYLSFCYDLKRCKLQKQKHIDEVCALVKITDHKKRLIKNLSKGYKQRVGLAQALLGDPKVLILDEPTVGLDPKQIIEIRNLIRSLGKGRTIILSSHILPEIQAICEKIVIISDGKIVANDTPDHLSQSVGNEHKLIARICGASGEVMRTLRAIEGVRHVALLGEKKDAADYAIESEVGLDIRKVLFRTLAEKNMPMIGLKTFELTLEDIFMKLVSGDATALSAQLNRENLQEETEGKIEIPEEEEKE